MANTKPQKEDSDNVGHVGFNAGRARKRAMRMLAAKLDYKNETELLKDLLDKAIAKHLPNEMQEIQQESQTVNR